MTGSGGRHSRTDVSHIASIVRTSSDGTDTGRKRCPRYSSGRPIRFLGYDPSPAPTTFAEAMEAQRRRLGWTYHLVANFVGVDHHTLLRWIKGGRVRLLRRKTFDSLGASATS